MFGEIRYETTEQLTHAIIRDEWTRDRFIGALKAAGTAEAPALVSRTGKDLLARDAESYFGISRAEFDRNYGAGQK